jgi:hypothetical protein
LAGVIIRSTVKFQGAKLTKRFVTEETAPYNKPKQAAQKIQMPGLAMID